MNNEIVLVHSSDLHVDEDDFGVHRYAIAFAPAGRNVVPSPILTRL